MVIIVIVAIIVVIIVIIVTLVRQGGAARGRRAVRPAARGALRREAMHVCVCVCMYIYIYIYIYLCMCIYMYIYIYTCIHVYYMYTSPPSLSIYLSIYIYIYMYDVYIQTERERDTSYLCIRPTRELQRRFNADGEAVVYDTFQMYLRAAPARLEIGCSVVFHPGGVGQVTSKFVILEQWECGTHGYPKITMTRTPWVERYACPRRGRSRTPRRAVTCFVIILCVFASAIRCASVMSFASNIVVVLVS